MIMKLIQYLRVSHILEVSHLIFFFSVKIRPSEKSSSSNNCNGGAVKLCSAFSTFLHLRLSRELSVSNKTRGLGDHFSKAYNSFTFSNFKLFLNKTPFVYLIITKFTLNVSQIRTFTHFVLYISAVTHNISSM